MAGNVKGDPVLVFDRRTYASLSDFAVDCRQANAVNVEVLPAGSSPKADISIEGAAERGGNYITISDPNGSQTNVTGNLSFDCTVGTSWVKARINNLTGSYAVGQGWTVRVTPYQSPAGGNLTVGGNINLGTTASIVLSTFAKASLPTAGTSGRLAYVTDTIRGVWGDNGSQWFSLSGEVVNVKEFGAKGDGATNDTAAIQAAINAAVALYSGLFNGNAIPIVYLPPGDYLCGTLSILYNVWFRGAGIRNTFLDLANATNAPLIDVGGAAFASSVNNVRISDMAMRGRSAHQTVAAPILRLRRVDRSFIDHCYLEDSKGSDILFSGVTETHVRDCQIYTAGTDGILVRASKLWLNNSLLNNNTGYGVRFEYDTSDLTVVGSDAPIADSSSMYGFIHDCHFEQNMTGEVYVHGVDNITAYRNEINPKGGAGAPAAIDLDGTSRNCRVVENLFQMAGPDSQTYANGSIVEMFAVRFGTGTYENYYQTAIAPTGLTGAANNGALKHRVLDLGRNYCGDFDDFHVRKITNQGGHPLAGWQDSAVTNYCLHSEDLTDAVWTNAGAGAATLSASTTVGSPRSATASATKAVYPAATTAAGTITQTITQTITAGDLWTFSVWVDMPALTTASVGHDFHIRIYKSDGTTLLADAAYRPSFNQQANAGKWDRFSASFVATTNDTGVQVQIYKFIRNGSLTYYFWGAQLNKGDIAPYISTAAATVTTQPGLVAQEASIRSLSINQGAEITKHLSGTKTWNPANLVDGATTTTTVTVTGAAVGDTCLIGFPLLVGGVAATAGVQVSGQVTATDTVTVVVTNHTGGAVDLDSGTLRADVWQH